MKFHLYVLEFTSSEDEDILPYYHITIVISKKTGRNFITSPNI